MLKDFIKNISYGSFTIITLFVIFFLIGGICQELFIDGHGIPYHNIYDIMMISVFGLCCTITAIIPIGFLYLVGGSINDMKNSKYPKFPIR